MERSLVSEIVNKVGEKVKVSGWVLTKRDHGKISFLDLSDRSGILQVVCENGIADGLHHQDVIEITGTVSARPEKLINEKLITGTIELQAESINVLSKSADLPFDMGGKDLDLTLPVLLDYRSLTLRHPKVKSIFKVQEKIVEGFRKSAVELGCTEIFTPTISYSSTEGGAEVFKIDYYGHRAFLIQSPQLYKQMMVPVFERVFLLSHAYRAEPSVTTRHLAESTQLDCELGFLEFNELLDAIEFVGQKTLEYVSNECSDILKDFEVEAPKFGQKIPRLKMKEALEIVSKRLGTDRNNELDLSPEDEREISKWALEEHSSDLVTITHYPTKKRSFYTMPDPENPEYSLSYDVLFRGVEILSGSQRIHDYEQLKAVIVERGMDEASFEMYLQAFKYGMPPHGGFSYGMERMTMKLLELSNVREASLYPRDMERVDIRLPKLEKEGQ